jgi:hypothetical protein
VAVRPQPTAAIPISATAALSDPASLAPPLPPRAPERIAAAKPAESKPEKVAALPPPARPAGRPEAAKAEGAKPEASRAETSKPDASRAEPGRPDAKGKAAKAEGKTDTKAAPPPRPEAAQAAPEDEGVQLFGITVLPSGRQIREAAQSFANAVSGQ